MCLHGYRVWACGCVKNIEGQSSLYLNFTCAIVLYKRLMDTRSCLAVNDNGPGDNSENMLCLVCQNRVKERTLELIPVLEKHALQREKQDALKKEQIKLEKAVDEFWHREDKKLRGVLAPKYNKKPNYPDYWQLEWDRIVIPPKPKLALPPASSATILSSPYAPTSLQGYTSQYDSPSQGSASNVANPYAASYAAPMPYSSGQNQGYSTSSYNTGQTQGQGYHSTYDNPDQGGLSYEENPYAVPYGASMQDGSIQSQGYHTSSSNTGQTQYGGTNPQYPPAAQGSRNSDPDEDLYGDYADRTCRQ
ncbi:hypothetical protein B0J14DRAFT_568262 [Halenospora varia]|nr:hypothetical protein B0J14DRAFT_568262 [Halenospora varia]